MKEGGSKCGKSHLANTIAFLDFSFGLVSLTSRIERQN